MTEWRFYSFFYGLRSKLSQNYFICSFLVNSNPPITRFAEFFDCANRAKKIYTVYVKYQKQYKPIYFFLDLIYNEIMNKYRFGIGISSRQCDACCIGPLIAECFSGSGSAAYHRRCVHILPENDFDSFSASESRLYVWAIIDLCVCQVFGESGCTGFRISGGVFRCSKAWYNKGAIVPLVI